MSERILVAVAWPYANGSIHLGHIAGAYLPADIFARYHRARGNDVLMVSGSDAHGTPVTLTAEQRGITPEKVFSEYQDEFLDNWDRLGITFDLFTSTHTKNHEKVSQEIFLSLYDKGFIYRDTMSQPFCVKNNRFLADRYVEGTCPNCGSTGARGDQCDHCGRTLDPKDLINLTCKLCGEVPVIKETEHFFLKLSVFEDELLSWVEQQKHWKPNVRNLTIGYLKGGLRDRAITRDIEWGVPVPLKGFEGKRIYVWFEAVIGYLSASKEFSKISGQPDKWKEFWKQDAKTYYFMGKDNIPFHTVIWPAMLSGCGGYNLPYDVPANEYLNLEGMKLSTSRNWAVWLKDYLDKYEPDPLRYVIAAGMPETSDSDFSWKEYIRRNNDELVATYGNLVHRVLTMVVRNYDSKIPSPGNLDKLEKELLSKASQCLESTGKYIETAQFRMALSESMNLAHAANAYLNVKAPWSNMKTDPIDASVTLRTCLAIINCLKISIYPFLPFSSQKLHYMLGFLGDVTECGWNWTGDEFISNQHLGEVTPLFVKLDEKILDRELKRLEN